MKPKKTILQIINIIFLALWAYAAFSKVFEYEIFKNQLAKSPLLGSANGIVAVVVPLMEIGIAGLLLFDKTKIKGLQASAILLGLFTIYLIGIINLAEHIPCSCGGLLSTLTWTQHIFLNVAFLTLAVIGLIIQRKKIDRHYDSLITNDIISP